MNQAMLNLLLADDDADDCTFFKEALDDLAVSTKLTTVNDGVQLMQLLIAKDTFLPDVLYLDLNMPRKNGFDCLTEIKQNQKLKQLPVIIFSTSFDRQVVDRLHEHGANYYIRKPAEFSNLKKVLFKSLNLLTTEGNGQPTKEKFVLTPS
jgi:CheY-like chemotaxis protein